MSDIRDHLRAMPSSLNDACRTMEVAADHIDELDKKLADIMDPRLHSMRLEDGKFDMTLGGHVVQHIATVMTEWFRESGAKNYIEMTMHARTEPFERYQFYVQKQGDGAKTPHQIRQEVEAQRDALVKALTDILDANAEFRRQMPEKWEGDPLQDACDAARVVLAHIRPEPPK